MTTILLTNELTTLASEAKRKNPELRNAADKSLQELRSVAAASEQQLAADLQRRPEFVEPFVIACATRNTKFAASGISCLQRLIVSGGLSRSRLQDAVQALNACADLGNDIQLKILQALPSLIQNYATDLQGDLLGSALQLCASLQASKTTTVSGVAAATLQSLVTVIFAKVATEDATADDAVETVEVPGSNGAMKLKPAAFDAYRVFRDLALAADERQTKFVQFQHSLPSLELIWSSMFSHRELFARHDELLAIIGSNIFPLIVRALSERRSFPITVRSLRLFALILERYMFKFAEDCEVALGLCTQALEYDHAATWKRALVMEVLRGLFTSGSQIVDAYHAFDMREDGKPVVQDILSAFVRLSTEKPTAIGLGQQSSVPTGPTSPGQSATEQAALEAAGGMAGVISFGATFGVAEINIAGVSSQWSLPKVLVIDQLDKHDPPALPETYPYALILECLNGLSDSLAKIILPLTVQHEKRRARSARAVSETTVSSEARLRSTSFRTRAVPLNPLDAAEAPYADRVSAVASIVDHIWPAVLATASTFLNAALDDQYFRNLIKAYQRFVQVAGVLRLSTPRDALMTTMAKVAIPPHVLAASNMELSRSPVAESPRIFSNPKNLLSVDSLVSHASTASGDGQRRSSIECAKPMLTVRNLLCLRALLNIAIALGPTLQDAFTVVLSALKQADMVLSTTTPQQLTRQSSFSAHGSTDNASIVQAFSAEVANVEKAASNLLESTADYPNESFIKVLSAFCQMLHNSNHILSAVTSQPDSDVRPTTPRTPSSSRRTLSGLPGISAGGDSRDYHFILPKLGKLAELNVTRFTRDEPMNSGWTNLVDELTAVTKNNALPKDARHSATNVLVKLAEATVADVVELEPTERAPVQERAIATLLRIVRDIYLEDGELSSTDLELQSCVFDSLRTILEKYGESLAAGWDRLLAIISSAFEQDSTTVTETVEAGVDIDWTHISFDLVTPQIGRIAFDAVQLLCSDFMESIPQRTVASLIELLHRFMCQPDDLNASLTTVTLALTVSDHLFAKCGRAELDDFMAEAQEFDDLEDDMKTRVRGCRPAQWLMLLVRLRTVATQAHGEVRNAAFQTICGVVKSHGDEMSPNSWDMLLRSTLMYISRVDSYSYMEDHASNVDSNAESMAPNIAMSTAIVAGQSAVIAHNLRLLEQVKKLPGLWEVFLNVLERYLDAEHHALNTVVYTSLARVLSDIDPSITVWQSPVYRTMSLWLKRVPHSGDRYQKQKNHSNQDAFTAYAEAGEQLYRLTLDSLSLSQARTLIDNLFHCVSVADGPLYGADTNMTSPLQAKVLSLLQSIKLGHSNLSACLITVAAKFATLHHDLARSKESSNQGPTFIAIAGEAILWLQELVTLMLKDQEAFDGDAFVQALQSLRQLIIAKYGVRAEQKGIPLWQKATNAALAMAGPAFARFESIDNDMQNQSLSHFVGILNGIISNDSLHHISDAQKIFDDQAFDIRSFQILRDVLIPRLRRSEVSDDLRLAYSAQLFKTSIIHDPVDHDSPEQHQAVVKDRYKTRNGRVRRVSYSPREDLAYICWKELATLCSQQGEHNRASDPLALAAGPLLIERLAIPIRAYIADQPLRGRRPQPLSELEELLFTFACIKDLKLPARTLVSDLQMEAAKQVFAETHLHLLYPLLIQAASTAGNKWSGAEEVLSPLQSLLTAIGTA
ncbi:hypothetical protein CKM354_000362300 [Cercospora kikuchii]|uniref:Endosomal peripheral membrane protein n=1 Tax=Cercospora kikuchii TaxID=84275 RepID=A0A9P3FDV8_9PEZI|nr:uncharacterized protein CKM354_000362300 [Cercospora kikuchii]GIZ40277.1 hypothetical protein CKM354_000362300 [Cercospora kikuchii]